MNQYNEIIKDVINIYDETTHPNIKCQGLKEEWSQFCFHSKNNTHKNFKFYKGSQYCNQIFNNYYECFVNDKKDRIK